MIKVTPLGYNVLLHLRPISEKKHGSIIVPDHHSEKIRICDVLEVGDKVTRVKKDDVVLLNFGNGVDLYLLENNWINLDVRMVSEDEIMSLAEESTEEGLYNFTTEG